MYCRNCFRQIETEEKPCPHCGYAAADDEREGNCLAAGTYLHNRYFIGRILGYGGFGVTYLAFDQTMSIYVAIKEYLPGEFSTRVPSVAKVTVYSGEKQEQFKKGKKEFIEEARRLVHFQNSEGIVHVYDCFEENETAYLVMEYLDGLTLRQAMEGGKVYTPEMAVEIMIPLLEVLEDIHQTGMLHRDIAPDNIFLTRDGKVKLIDFGAARYATTSHSRSLSVIIKEGYAPEEQYRSRGDQGPWTDVYGVAATLYKMITGITPEESVERALKDTLKEPSKLGVKINKGMENAIMNGLNLKIEDRPQSAGEFKSALIAETTKRNKKKYRKEDVGEIPLWIKCVAAISLSCILVFVGLLAGGIIHFDLETMAFYQLEEGKTRVPNLINGEIKEAQTRTEAQELKLLIVGKEYSEDIPQDRILYQALEAGEVVDIGKEVEVTVSGGVEQEQDESALADDECYMPMVEYKTMEEAKQLLTILELIVEISYEQNDIVAEGHVISQSCESGTILKKGELVKLVISSGEDGIVEGMEEIEEEIPLEDEEEEVEDEVEVTIEEEPEEEAVISPEIVQSYQNPSQVKEGETVTVYGIYVDNTTKYRAKWHEYMKIYDPMWWTASLDRACTVGIRSEGINFSNNIVFIAENGERLSIAAAGLVDMDDAGAHGHLVKVEGRFYIDEVETYEYEDFVGTYRQLSDEIEEEWRLDSEGEHFWYTYRPQGRCYLYADSITILQ